MELNKKGITLIASVILIIFAAIVVLSVSTFVIERLSQNQIYSLKAKTIYLAQAGIHKAIYDFRFRKLSGNGYLTFGQANIDANNFFVIGGSAGDLIMVDASGANLSNNGRDLSGLTIQNATNSNTITIDRIIVTWNNNNKLRQIRIGNSTLFNDAQGLSSPANADLSPDFTLDAVPTVYNITRLRFDADMSGATITIQFLMTDSTLSAVFTVFPASSASYSFGVKSMGKTANSNLYRTIQARYNPATGKIISYDEINQSLP